MLPQELDRILYLDVDTVVINSLRPLYESEFGDACFMACTHTRKALSRINRIRLGIKENVPYVNTGVMLMNLAALRETLNMEDVKNYVAEKPASLILPDQDIITALYGDRVIVLDSMVYFFVTYALGIPTYLHRESLSLISSRSGTKLAHRKARAR